MPDDALIDAAGTRHVPAGSDARIVSLVPSITELVVDLGLAEQLVGRTHYCVHPKAVVDGIPSLGGTKKISLRRLRDVAPSHVILNVDENTVETAKAVAEIAPHLIVTHPLHPRDNPALYRLIGGLFGKAPEAEALRSRFDDAYHRLTAAVRNLPDRRVLYLIWRDPWMTVSRDTYIAGALALIGWETLCHDPDTRYPEVAMTADLLAATDLVLFSSEPYAFTQEHVDAFRAEHGARPRALLVDGEYTSWYGSRAIAGLDYLRRFAQSLA